MLKEVIIIIFQNTITIIFQITILKKRKIEEEFYKLGIAVTAIIIIIF